MSFELINSTNTKHFWQWKYLVEYCLTNSSDKQNVFSKELNMNDLEVNEKMFEGRKKDEANPRLVDKGWIVFENLV